MKTAINRTLFELAEIGARTVTNQYNAILRKRANKSKDKGQMLSSPVSINGTSMPKAVAYLYYTAEQEDFSIKMERRGQGLVDAGTDRRAEIKAANSVNHIQAQQIANEWLDSPEGAEVKAALQEAQED